MNETLTIEVFPIEQARWIAVVDAPAGAFSTEVAAPNEVPDEVRRCIREVLGRDVPFVLIDDLGRTWDFESAREQFARLVSSSGS